MGLHFSFVKRKTEDAIEAVINRLKKQGLSGVTIVKGFDMGEIPLSRIEIMFGTAIPEREGLTPSGGYYTGNYTVVGSIALVSHTDDDTRPRHSQRCGLLEDIIMRDDIEDQINNFSAVSQYKIHNPGWWPGPSEDSTNGKEVLTEYNLEVYCRPSTPAGD